LDYRSIAFFVIILLALGTLAVVSVEFLSDYKTIGAEKGSLFLNHIVKLVVGMLVLAFFSSLDYKIHFSRNVISVYYFLSILGLVLALVTGSPVGARRWIKIGGITVQPSEFVKVIMIIFLSYYVSKYSDKMKNILYGLILPIAYLLPLYFLVALEPDMSTFLIMFFVTLLILYTSGTRGIYVFSFIVLSILTLLLLYKYGFLRSYQIQRIEGFLKGEVSEQVLMAIEAAKSGGIFGKGLNLGELKILVPVSTSDFVIAVIGEELGYFGIAAVFFSYYGLVSALIKSAQKFASNIIIRTFITGYGILIMVQAMVNLGVTAGLLPVTGVTLPFVSHGGSSLTAFMIGLGIVMSMILRSEER